MSRTVASHYTEAQRKLLIILQCAEYKDPRVEADGSVSGEDWDTGERKTIMSSSDAHAYLKSPEGTRELRGIEHAASL